MADKMIALISYKKPQSFAWSAYTQIEMTSIEEAVKYAMMLQSKDDLGRMFKAEEVKPCKCY